MANVSSRFLLKNGKRRHLPMLFQLFVICICFNKTKMLNLLCNEAFVFTRSAEEILRLYII
jgi:hypothetical protein